MSTPPASRAKSAVFAVGSYVPKTAAQLTHLLTQPGLQAIELEVSALLDPTGRSAVFTAARTALHEALTAGRDCVLATSRRLITGSDDAASLGIGRLVSDALIELVRSLAVRARFLIAKGGITSSDVANLGLGVRRAMVRGQILPGVPVWRTGPESKFPGLDFVVFPGNVGGETALAEVVAKFSR